MKPMPARLRSNEVTRLHSERFWHGKNVFITGASSGIGKAVALELARRGARVGLFARRHERLQRLVDQIRSAGDSHALALPGDAARREDVLQAVQRLIDQWGPVDVLLANSGISLRGRSETDAKAVAEVMTGNVLGAVYAVEAVLPGMQARGRGHIAAVSSAVALLPRLTGRPTYAASKEAMGRYFEGLRPRLRRHGISVTVIYPGFVHTEMTVDNKFMPFVLGADVAARRIVRGIAQGHRRLVFPRRAIWLGRIAQWVPARRQRSAFRRTASR